LGSEVLSGCCEGLSSTCCAEHFDDALEVVSHARMIVRDDIAYAAETANTSPQLASDSDSATQQPSTGVPGDGSSSLGWKHLAVSSGIVHAQ
jgi:hypothetical protein